MGEPCYSIVRKPKGFESSNELSLKKKIEGDDLERCQTAIEEVLQTLLDGDKFASNLMMPIINRYQMNRFSGHEGQDKRIKKLLYVLWECLPKRGPDGKFMDKMVMVCGAFDRDLKHPNQYVCGNVLRTLSKTRESEVIRELVHSIEKCLEWSHGYQRKNAALAIARIYKNFPDLNPTAPKLLSEYLLKENDDDCKKAALQALLEIAPDEAKLFLHSCNIPDIHCMNASIQLLFVELIQKVYKRGSDECESYIEILTSLIRSSSSPSVRYQAAVALMKFSRDPEAIKIVASCFIDICAKDSDNNVKLIALDNLMNLRRVKGAERVLRDSIMSVLCILQSAKDLELHERILRLSLDLISPMNVGEIIAALRQEMRKMQDMNVFSSTQETFKYRRLLVNTVHQIAERFPNAIIEHEMLDTLFDLLVCNSIGERTASRVILLFKVFMSNNVSYQPIVIKKVQSIFNSVKDNPSIHRGLIQLLGDFSEGKNSIEESYRVIKDSLGELPIVASEMRKIAQANEGSLGDQEDSNSKKTYKEDSAIDGLTKGMNRLVTADGSYAKQSAINYQATASGDDTPPLRSYFLGNKFGTTSVLCYAFLKMACRYREVVTQPDSDKMIARLMFIIASILNLGNSSLTDSEGNPIHINNDHAENLLLSLTILQHLSDDNNSEVSKLLQKIVTDEMRSQLGLIVSTLEVDRFALDDDRKALREQQQPRFDDPIDITQLPSRDEDVGFDVENRDSCFSSMGVSGSNLVPDLFGEIPLTGTVDPIYAYCEFDVNQYDIGLKIYLENRSKSRTFESVSLELSAQGEGASKYIDRPESVVLAPRATACIHTNIKVVSAETRRLHGSITYEDFSASDDKDCEILLNEISINITDYINPATISFDEFRDVWRDCEWENKVQVKTKHTNLKEYLHNLVQVTNMRCVTADRGLAGDCLFLSANLYAKSSFGEEALVNVSIEKETISAAVTGSVKIRSRSQGMALSLGEKIQGVQ